MALLVEPRGELCYDIGRGFEMSMATPPICVDPDVLSGEPVFVGTRVPVSTFIDYLKAGDSIDDFLDDFPTVSRQQTAAVLEVAGEALTRYARSA